MLFQTIHEKVNLTIESTSSLPRVIEFMQYVKTWDGQIVDRVGTLGESNFAYSLKFDSDFVVDKPTSGLMKIKRMLLNRYVIKISRDEIFDKFWVYEISDVSNKAMTIGFSDFDVECYNTTGRKIFNGIVAILKSFTTKTAYVLIDKEYIKDQSSVNTIDILIEPKLIANPDNDPSYDNKAFLQSTNFNDKTNVVSFYISNNKHNDSRLYSNDPLDYDVCVKNTIAGNVVYEKLNISAYRLKIKTCFDYIISYTNFQTFSNRDAGIVQHPEKFVYDGDYFKQSMTAFAQKIAIENGENVVTGDVGVLQNNLIKYLPLSEDDRASLIIELELDYNAPWQNIVLVTKQFKKKYSEIKSLTSNNVIFDLSNLNLYKYSDFEIFYYGYTINGVQRYTGQKISSLDYDQVTINNGIIEKISLKTPSNYTSGFFEYKLHNDNKRTTNLFILAKSDGNSTINILNYLYTLKYYKFNINLNKADVRCYVQGLFKDIPITNNSVTIPAVKDNIIQIQIRDFSHAFPESEYLTTVIGSDIALNDIIFENDSVFDIINEKTNIMDLGLNISPEHELSDDEVNYLHTNEIILNEFDTHYDKIIKTEEIGYKIINNTINISDSTDVHTLDTQNKLKTNYTTLKDNLNDKAEVLSKNMFIAQADINTKMSKIKELYCKIACNSNITMATTIPNTGIKIIRDETTFIYLVFDSATTFEYRVYNENNLLLYKELSTSSVNVDNKHVGIILTQPFDFSNNTTLYYKITPNKNFGYYVFGGGI